MSVTPWTKEQLHTHLQAAIDLEFWTITFYRTAYHAVMDSYSHQSNINTVSVQEMFHTQCAWNLARAFGTDYDFATRSFDYSGTTIPHLNFAIDTPNPATVPVTINGQKYDFTDYSAELNPSSFQQRINAMCLIEYPDWGEITEAQEAGTISEYASIGHFYAALQNQLVGLPQSGHTFTPTASALFNECYQANNQQLNVFGDNAPGISNVINAAASKSNAEAAQQVYDLITAIVEEGEGTSSSNSGIETKYQFGGDDTPHFEDFQQIYNSPPTAKQLNTMNADGAKTISDYLKGTFQQQVQDLFTGATDWSTFGGQMYSFDNVISGVFSS